MQIIDRQVMERPFYGVRQMTWHLRNEGYAVVPKRVRRLMGVMPIDRRPNTSKPAKGSRLFPYLPRGLTIDRPIPAPGAPTSPACRCGGAVGIALGPVAVDASLYRVAIMDWQSPRVLAWRLSNTLEAEFCADAPLRASDRPGS